MKGEEYRDRKRPMEGGHREKRRWKMTIEVSGLACLREKKKIIPLGTVREQGKRPEQGRLQFELDSNNTRSGVFRPGGTLEGKIWGRAEKRN